MGFLDQLRQEAQAVQARHGVVVQHLDANVAATEEACQRVAPYLSELAAQLNIIQPAARDLSLDGKTRWPAMKLVDFRFDARKKILRQREVTDHIALGWRVVPAEPNRERGSVTVNFPPDLERVEARLRAGQIRHERLEQRNPETNKLLAIEFAHDWAARGSMVFTADHDQACMGLRLSGVVGLTVQQQTVPVGELGMAWLDELARAVVGQPCRWG
jgi:hypothetical protein